MIGLLLITILPNGEQRYDERQTMKHACLEKTDSFQYYFSGAHLLLFCLVFVFGSFCTFCFHMLMYLFDGKCVLYPKLLLLNSLRHNAYDFIPLNTEKDKKFGSSYCTYSSNTMVEITANARALSFTAVS